MGDFLVPSEVHNPMLGQTETYLTQKQIRPATIGAAYTYLTPRQARRAGMGDLYSSSQARAELDKAKSAENTFKNLYAAKKSLLTSTQINNADTRATVIRNAVRRAENTYTAEYEKPMWVNSDYDLAVKNARQAVTYADHAIREVNDFLRYNQDEKARLVDMERSRQYALAQQSQVSPEELKAAQGGLLTYAGHKAKEAGKEVGKVTAEIIKESADVGGAIAKNILGAIPWYVWVIGAAGLGLYFAGPTLIAKKAFRRG
jgi:hypothetical protein